MARKRRILAGRVVEEAIICCIGTCKELSKKD